MAATLGETAAENPSVERLCWYIASDGPVGMAMVKAVDPDAASAFELETSLARSEYLELGVKVALDLDTAMPAIVKGMEDANG